jgi:hypothetical protein
MVLEVMDRAWSINALQQKRELYFKLISYDHPRFVCWRGIIDGVCR